jgi:hypothetical protein
MAMTLPTIPQLPAGYVVQVADMNALANCATFLMTKPMARAYDGTGGQTIPATTETQVAYTAVNFDTDGMWAVGHPSRFTIQTPGFYKFNYSVITNGVTCRSQMTMVTGANNPQGAGVTPSSHLASSAVVNTMGGSSGGGVWPYYLWPLDYIYVTTYCNALASQWTSTSTTPGSCFSAEWMSM